MKKLAVSCRVLRSLGVGGWLLAVSVAMAADMARAAELPEGYTAVEGIFVPAGSYIDTGYKPNQNTRVVMDVIVQCATEYWFGCWDTNYNKGAFAFGNDGGGIYAGYGNQGGTFGKVVGNGRHTVELDGEKVKVDGKDYHSFSEESFTLTHNLYLFAQNRAGTAVWHNSQTSIICHGCTISEGGSLKRSFVPCIRKSDGAVGLYDTEGDSFYENIGMGKFIVLQTNQTLTTGTYEFSDSFAVIAPAGESALKVADGATVTLNIPFGVTVTLKGGDAFGTTGAGAGIEVPASAKLVITGAGTLNATGGKAANGANGEKGTTPASYNESTQNSTAASGGKGGAGGGGAGAGIGGCGGKGGNGGAGGASFTDKWDAYKKSGNPGEAGTAGVGGGACGTIEICGTVKVIAAGGAAGANGSGGDKQDWCPNVGSTYYWAAYGSGGGGGGGGGSSASDIGGGGGGGGGAGGGGGSGLSWSKQHSASDIISFKKNGLGGEGGHGDGSSGGDKGKDRSGEQVTYYNATARAETKSDGGGTGGAGGSGGAAGAKGENGSVAVKDHAVVVSEELGYSVGRISETVDVFWKLGKLYRVENGVNTEIAYTNVTADTSAFVDGKWYVVKDIVSRGAKRENASGYIEVNGTANLVLLHKASLTVNDAPAFPRAEAGISVLEGTTLNIFGVESGTLVAKGDGSGGAGIGSCGDAACGTITIYGGTVTAQGGGRRGERIGVWSGAGIGGGCEGAGGRVTINGGTVTATGGPDAPSVGAGTDCGNHGSLTQGPRVLRVDDNHWKTIGEQLDVKYVSQDGTIKSVNALVLGSDGSFVNAAWAWYVVKGEVSIGQIAVSGEVNLILADGTKLTSNGGIRVDEGDTLSIHVQEAGSGVLVANGGDGRAGIGGDCRRGGTVTINGGTVTATGGYRGAGIGGGKYGAGGTVTINGGTVTATGGWHGAGIGSGDGWTDGGALGTITINGGTVTATGGWHGAGIGGGSGSSGEIVIINGGEVTARGSEWGAGIGGGNQGFGCETVTINGGTVTATGGYDGAGIGGGKDKWARAVRINGGMVTATGNGGGKGIGGGGTVDGGPVGITITGGTVLADGYNGQGLETVTIDGGSAKTKVIDGLPRNSKDQRLHEVTVKGWEGLEGLVSLEGLEGYGTKDIYPIDGYIYLYLPDGEYQLRVTSGSITKSVSFAVMGDDVTVVLGATGQFFINGVDFGMGSGDGWTCSDNRLVLSKAMTYVLTGAKDGLSVEVQADATVVLSNATITTSGKPTLSVADMKSVKLQMLGFTSYLFATNASAIALGADVSLTVGSAEGADQFAKIVVSSYGDGATAISGAAAAVEVESGSFLVKSDVKAVDGSFGISEMPECPLLMKTGSSSDGARYADSYNSEAFVGVVPSYTITVPPFVEGVASVVVSNDVEELNGEDGVYRAMLAEKVTLDFIAAEGYGIASGWRLYIPSLTNDVTVGDEGYPWPDIRRMLTVTLPETLAGETSVVTEGGAEVEGKAEGEGKKVYSVRSGYDVEVVCTAEEGWRIVSETNVVSIANIQESKVLTTADLPQAWRLFTVTVPKMENVIGEVSSTDGQMVTTEDGTALILSNAEVTVTFVAFGNYRIAANGVKTWRLAGDVTFGTTESFPLPTLEGVPGTIVAPWSVGENVVAYTNATGELTIEGTGEMDDFASAADVPWDSNAVTSTVVDERVTKVGANSFVALADYVLVNGLPSSQFRSISPGFMSASSQPSGAISPAEFERIDIIDGKAYLGVSVFTNSEVKVKGEGWGVATNGVIEVPAPGKQGFFYLMSKPAVPSNRSGRPDTADVQHD